MGKHTRGKTLGITPNVQLPQRLPQGLSMDERLRRLNPAERHDVQAIIRRLLLRKTIRRTLAIAYHSRSQPSTPPVLLASPSPELKELSLVRLQTFEPVIVHGELDQCESLMVGISRIAADELEMVQQRIEASARVPASVFKEEP